MSRPHQRLGQMLVERKLITPEQLDQALANQVVYEGRLGTNLVELGFVELNYVGRALGVQLGAPHADMDLLNAASSEAMNLLPGELCAKYRLLPFRREGGELHVAMMDPRREDIVSALAGRLGLQVRPFVCPELRLLYYLEKLYGVPREKRFLRFSIETAPLPGRTSPPVRTYLAPTVRPEEGATLGEDSVNFLDQLASQAKQPSAIETLIPALDSADCGSAIARAMVTPLFPQTALGALFWVRGKMAVATHAHNTPLTMDQIQRLVVPLDEPSLLQWAFSTQSPVRAEAANDTLQGQISSFFNSPEAGEACVVPVHFQNRVVSLLCVHSMKGTIIPDRALLDLRQVAQHAAAAYERLMQKARKG